nr:OmpW family outer membrane protein [Hyphomicrobium sp.]
GDLKAGLGADASIPNIVVPTATITYFFNEHWAVEGVCCAAYVKGVGTKGLEGTGKLVDAWVLPPVVTLQYHFTRFAGFQPYVGAGVQWIHFWGGKGDNALGASSVAIEDSIGPAIQAGIDYDLGQGWSLNLDVKKAWADTTISWRNAGSLDTVKANVDLDPLWITGSIGYRFNFDDLLGHRTAAASLK